MLDTEEARSHAALMDLVRQLLEQATGVEAHTLYNDAPFQEIGLTSLAILNFNELIQPLFADLNKTLLFDCRCIRDVATHLLREHPQASASYLQRRPPSPPPPTAGVEAWPSIAPLAPCNEEPAGDIAIVGLHGRFPGADDLDALWRNLLAGVDSVSEIPAERWPLDGFFAAGSDARSSGLSYAKWGGFLPDIDRFDAQFFAIAPRECTAMVRSATSLPTLIRDAVKACGAGAALAFRSKPNSLASAASGRMSPECSRIPNRCSIVRR